MSKIVSVFSFINDLTTLTQGVVSINLYKLKSICSRLREADQRSFIRYSEDAKNVLIKRGCIMVTLPNGIETFYTPTEIIYFYKKLNYNKQELSDAMKLDGATDMDVAYEFGKLDSYLKPNTLDEDDFVPEISEEQYERAVVYLEVEGFVDSLAGDITLEPMERLNIISELTDYTLNMNSLVDEEVTSKVSEKVLAVVNRV